MSVSYGNNDINIAVMDCLYINSVYSRQKYVAHSYMSLVTGLQCDHVTLIFHN